MPPACFLNVPTLSVLAALGHLSQREMQGMLLTRYTKESSQSRSINFTIRRLLPEEIQRVAVAFHCDRQK